MAAETAGFTATLPRRARAGGLESAGSATAARALAGPSRASTRPWRPAVDRAHAAAATAALAGTALVALASPAAAAALATASGPLLLLGGALVGVPHGSSDFVVAHRLMRPALGPWWLPAFLAGYLALVALAMGCWAALPLATLLGFLALSGLHFGWGDMRAAAPPARPALAFAVRATTPVLPIFLIHPAGVAPFLAALGGVPEAGALRLLEALRWPLGLPWAAALALVALPPLLAPAGRRAGARESGELVAVALAAAALPPLLGFGLYFCLVHAPRHMAELAGDHHPTRPAAAARLAAAVVLPSALACLALLSVTWDGLAGFAGTEALVTWSLRVIAALTVPHMALEALAARRPARPAA